MITENNLNEIGNNRFISRLPALYRECGQAIRQAINDANWGCGMWTIGNNDKNFLRVIEMEKEKKLPNALFVINIILNIPVILLILFMIYYFLFGLILKFHYDSIALLSSFVVCYLIPFIGWYSFIPLATTFINLFGVNIKKRKRVLLIFILFQVIIIIYLLWWWITGQKIIPFN